MRFKGRYCYFVQPYYLDDDCCCRIIARPYAYTTMKHSTQATIQLIQNKILVRIYVLKKSKSLPPKSLNLVYCSILPVPEESGAEKNLLAWLCF